LAKTHVSDGVPAKHHVDVSSEERAAHHCKSNYWPYYLSSADWEHDGAVSRPQSTFVGKPSNSHGDMRGLTPPPAMRRDSEGVWSEEGSEVLLVPPGETPRAAGAGEARWS
jgi:hypothetical protein